MTHQTHKNVPVFNLSNIDGALFLACNGTFGQQLLDALDASADAENLSPPIFSFVQQLDSHLQYWRRRQLDKGEEHLPTGTSG